MTKPQNTLASILPPPLPLFFSFKRLLSSMYFKKSWYKSLPVAAQPHQSSSPRGSNAFLLFVSSNAKNVINNWPSSLPRGTTLHE